MKRTLFLLALIGILMAALAACSQAPPATPTPLPAAPKPAGPAPSGWDSLVEAAKKEGSVVVYVSQIGEARDVSTEAFRKAYGIDIEWAVGRGEENITKVTAQRSAGLYLADAMFTGGTTYYGMLKSMKITVPLEPLLVLPEVTDPSKWRPGKIPFVGNDPNYIAIAAQKAPSATINIEMVKDGEITSLEDILAAKWKSKIVLNDPTVTGAGNGWFSYIVSQVYGKEKGKEFMTRLAKQEPAIIRDQRLALEWIARGRYPVGFGMSPSELAKLVGAGAPIKGIALKEGGQISLGSFGLLAIDKPPHPNAAKLFINWVLGREAGAIWNKHSGYVSERTDVSTEGIPPFMIPGPKDILPGGEDQLEQVENLRLAAEVFKALLK